MATSELPLENKYDDLYAQSQSGEEEEELMSGESGGKKITKY